MLITQNKLQHWIDNFYGYGSWDARIWFIAFEEGGGNVPEDVAEKLDYFSTVHPQHQQPALCDIRNLYSKVQARLEGPRSESYATLYDYRFGPTAIQHGIWKNIIAFEFGYKNQDVPDLLTYQKNLFLDPTKDDIAWLQLFPLPSPHNHAWYYRWLDMPQLPFLKSRNGYQEHLYAIRMENLLRKISEFKPTVVVMYGMENINGIKNSCQDHFENVKFRTVKGTKGKIPQHHQLNVNGTTIILTTQIPTLRHNRIETGFDWETFGRTLK